MTRRPCFSCGSPSDGEVLSLRPVRFDWCGVEVCRRALEVDRSEPVSRAPRSIDLVREFHQRHGAPVNSTPGIDPARVKLRLDLIAEEFKELVEACGYTLRHQIEVEPPDDHAMFGYPLKSDIVEAADALGDLEYVINGAALEWGVPLPAVVAEVHRSNMTKEPGPTRGDGKILKTASYSPPDLASVLWPEGRP